jgi:hypothetical protein
MNCRLVLSVALLLLPVAMAAQTTTNDKMESGTANARIIAARKAASAVTVQQCLADLSSWGARDNADDKAKAGNPNFWYQKVSTEALVQLSTESLYCGPVLRRVHRRNDVPLMHDYEAMFSSELLHRAEAVLLEHHLMHEYLLKSSE